MVTSQASFAAINGTKMYYEIKGEGKPLVMIHGLPVDSRMWDAQFDELSKQFQVIRFDLPGYGRSHVHHEDYHLLKDIKSLLEYLNIERMNLLGLSVGGKLGIEFTLEHPEMVDSLIVASTGLTGWTKVSPQKQKHDEEMNKCYQKRELEKAIRLMCQAWTAGPFRKLEEVNPVVQKQFSDMVRHSFTKERGTGKLIFPETNYMAIVDQINAPTLIITPEYDFPEFKQIADYLHSKIIGSEKITLPDTAHMLNMEKPAEFNSHIIDFLKR